MRVSEADAIVATAYRFAARQIRDQAAVRIGTRIGTVMLLLDAARELEGKADRLFPLERDAAETE